MTTKEITLVLPVSVETLSRDQSKAEALAESLAAFKVTSAEEYALADDMLGEVARRLAAVVNMRKGATKPLYTYIHTVEAWFRPYVRALEKCEGLLKGSMGAFRVAREAEEREARELAAKAAESGDAGALVEALTAATEAGAKPEARSSTRFMWAVDTYNVREMDRAHLIPNMPLLEAHARSHKGDTPPVVTGVTFKRVVQIGAKK